MTQRESNPFRFSDTNKRYHTYDYYLRCAFGVKCAKLPLDAGLSCPNIDGGCGSGGCIYCSARGSGDFAPEARLSITEQIARQKELYAHKWDTSHCIAYFQAHTNTYAPCEHLRALYEEALGAEGIVGINIATRADCLPPDVLALLSELAERTVLTVELGLQSSNDQTAARIGRGHNFATFVQGYRALRAASDRIRIGVHLILGLPGEGEEEMRKTARDVAALHPNEVKLHLLHVLRGTPLARMYESGAYTPLSQEDYVRLVVETLELLPPDTVIGRLTGDGMGEELLAPLWSRRKIAVINDVDKLLFSSDRMQGDRYGTA